MQSDASKLGVKVCVTGAGGYIGSWLVKKLLQRGYTVNATLKNPENGSETGPLLSLPGAADRLKLFHADLCEEGSFDSAVEGCEGVFHLAGPVSDPNLCHEDDFVQPAVKGVLNVLNACSRAESVRRMVYTSSVTAASPLNGDGELISGCCMDESRWTPVDIMRTKSHPSKFYCISKTLAEKAAIEYGLNSGQMEVVTIGPSCVGGPCIASNFSSSCRLILGAIAGDYEVMKVIQSLMGSVSFVHVDDVCEAHIFLMEQPNVAGRHICSAYSLTIPELAHFIQNRYSHSTSQSQSGVHEGDCSVFVPASSKKLLDLGFSFKYSLEDIFDETIECAKSYDIMK